ncbi:thiamine biosynthesis protein ThiS [Arachidicoccus rhizosphaerae]|jgi:sulfur carrier protein|uniref:Thiamine biosynthesis protein ThiS n=1 Tax=Arachidicoccus rhizosphaerae TaxID=551991 RepID=A0A1H3YZ57_9BACT|nr:sulfur carrier protein ThiS [Arachidicoccus rhizosphaerae]SEA16697.1 thiamine biosynthesis protein ThiS [Arachidicoccus rhizosphaerae]
MELEINQTIHYFPDNLAVSYGAGDVGLSLKQVMAFLYKDNQQGLAVAVDNQVIARADWSNTFLKTKDKLLILTASQGG